MESAPPSRPRELCARLTVMERNKALAYLSTALVACGPLMLLVGGLTGESSGIMGIHAVIAGAILRSLVMRANFRAKRRSAEVRVSAKGVSVDGALVAARDAIADGYFQPRVATLSTGAGAYHSSVRMVDKRRHVLFEAEVDDEDEALEILHRLGLDPERKRAEFSGASPLFATRRRQLTAIFGACAILFTLGGIGGMLQALGGIILALIALPLVIVALIPSKIVVGADGVLVRWLWMRRFISMGQIAKTSTEGGRCVHIHFTSGKSHLLYTSAQRRGDSLNAIQHRDGVLARIEEARAAFHAREPGMDVSSLLSRGTRSLSEWLAALRALATKARGYREVVVRPDNLWRLVEDPASPEDARAAAALLLRLSLDDEGKARVRVAAGATASPRLRVALEAAAADSDDVIERALGEMAAEEDAVAARARAATA